MGTRITAVAVSKLPNPDCRACNGIGAVPVTVHFAGGDRDLEWPCWECFGHEVRLPLPRPDSAEK